MTMPVQISHVELDMYVRAGIYLTAMRAHEPSSEKHQSYLEQAQHILGVDEKFEHAGVVQSAIQLAEKRVVPVEIAAGRYELMPVPSFIVR